MVGREEGPDAGEAEPEAEDPKREDDEDDEVRVRTISPLRE